MSSLFKLEKERLKPFLTTNLKLRQAMNKNIYEKFKKRIEKYTINDMKENEKDELLDELEISNNPCITINNIYEMNEKWFDKVCKKNKFFHHCIEETYYDNGLIIYRNEKTLNKYRKKFILPKINYN